MDVRDRRVWGWLSVSVALVLLAAVYFFFDPAESAWMPKCVWKTLTGTDCPGCGTQRMAHALLRGDLAAAWRANALALLALPVIAFLFWIELNRARHPRLYMRLHRPATTYILLALILAWWIFRNIV